MRARIVVLPLLAAVLLAACAGPGAAAPRASGPLGSAAPSSSADSALDGRSFVSTAVTGRTLVPGTHVALRFGAGQLGADAGCNAMSATYQIVGGTLGLGQMATTEMACNAPLTAQDQWLAAFLPGAAIDLSPISVTLTKDGVAVSLVDQATTDLPLAGTSWTITAIVSGGTIATVPKGVTARLVLGNGQFVVNTGCNSGTGSATVGDGVITFGTPAITAVQCGTDAMATERAVLAALAGDVPFAIAGDTLTLGASGKDGLVLTGPTVQPAGPASPYPGAS